MVKINELVPKIKNVDFEITFDCNLKCLHCYNKHDQKVDELDLSKILDIIKQIKEIGIEEIHINGGEPLKHKDVLEILKYACSLGLNVLLETNATLLNRYIDDLKNLSNLSIRASIDGPRENHNIIRRNKNNIDSFNLAVNNLKKASEAKIPVQATCSVNKINYNKIYQMVKELNDEGLSDIRLRLSMPSNYAYIHWMILKLSNDNFKEVKKQIEKIKTDFPSIKFNGDSIKRTKPMSSPKFFITPNGDVKPYPFIDYFIGNLKEESVLEILQKYEKIRLPEDYEKLMIDYLSELNLV